MSNKKKQIIFFSIGIPKITNKTVWMKNARICKANLNYEKNKENDFSAAHSRRAIY